MFRHLIILPPLKSRLFGEQGVAMLQYFHEFLELGNIKNSDENLWQDGRFVVLIGRFLAICGNKSNIEMSKIRDFGFYQASFGKFFELFFFQIRFSSKIVRPENTKSRLLLWLPKMIFMHILFIFDDLKNLSFSNLFCGYQSVERFRNISTMERLKIFLTREFLWFFLA
jgi:hypothetical protein